MTWRWRGCARSRRSGRRSRRRSPTARLHEQLSVEKLQATQTVEQLRELPEQATELRSQLQDHAMALGDQAGDLYQDLVARGQRVVESRR